MKTFEKFIDEVVLEYQTAVEALMPHVPFDTSGKVIEEAAKRYARQCCEDVLNRAAENAEVKIDYLGMDRIAFVDKESITSTEIILP